MDEKSIGYISLSRRVFEDTLWTEDRPKTPFEAWLWLIQAARFEKGQQKLLMGGKVVAWSRGQVPGSVRFLGDQWKWDKNKVDRFLKFLVKDGRISKDVDVASGQIIITLLNYDKYNPGKQDKKDSKRDSKRDTELQDSKGNEGAGGTVNGTVNGTPPGQPRDKTNKDNKGNNIGGTANAEPPAPGSDEERFKNLQIWILTNAPRVAQLKEPFSQKQYITLRKKFTQKALTDVLSAMHNKASLLKDYTSAYLTCKNWLERREKDGEKVLNDGSTGETKQSKATLIGQQVAGTIKPV